MCLKKLLPELSTSFIKVADASRRISGRRSTPEGFKAGSILVVVIWIVSMLVILVVGLAGLVSARVHSFKNFRDSTRAYLIAKGAVNKAIIEVHKEAKSSWYDALKEPWSTNSEEFEEIDLGGGSAVVSCQRYSLDNKAVTFYGMLDEESLINIKTDYTDKIDTLTNLFIEMGEVEPEEAQQIANAILDWIDAGEDDKPREGGAEDAYYLGLDPPYECKDADFDVIEELLLVKGVTPEIFIKVKDYLTVFGDGQININTAGWEVLLALGLPDSLVDKVIRFRAGDDEIEGTEDDRVITKATNLGTRISTVIPLSVDERNLLNNLYSPTTRITVKSQYYRIHAQGTVNDKTRQITCVVKRGGRIVFWQEH